MLTRRGWAQCALCAALGVTTRFTATQAAPDNENIRRTILRRADGPTPETELVLAEALVAPHALVPRHIHPGIESGYLVEGSAILEMQDAPPLPLKAGDGVVIAARRPHLLRNGDGPTRIVSTYILEKGQPIAIPV